MKKVAIYSRKSKETDTGESIKNQIQMCKDYFARKNETFIFEIFQDEGFSGSNINRPEFQRMMLLAKSKEFDIIACYKVDRIARNIIDFMNTFDELEKNNITLVSVTEGFDPSTPAGRMMMTMIAGFAEMERMNIAQRVKDKMNALAKENDDLNKKILLLEEQVLLENTHTMNIHTLQNNIQILLSNWDKLPMEKKQIEIGNIISEIRFKGDGNFDVIFNIL